MTTATATNVKILLHFAVFLVVVCLIPISSSFTFPSTSERVAQLARLSTAWLVSSSSDSTKDVDKTIKKEECLLNSAFVFVKPHANNPKVQDLVRDKLLAKSIKIKSEGDIPGSAIDEKKLIDQHYYAIASKATLLDPKDMAVPADKFKEFFGETWQDVLSNNKAANAMQACERLGVDANGLEQAWRECEPKNKVVKFGGGFYCGLLEVEGKDPLYVFNAFFMNMRSKFTGDDASIHYYEVEWKPNDLSWADFRGTVLGPTDPSAAPEGAIRKEILDQWKDLGLADEPNRGDNGVHASASPFEGLAEKLNWMEKDIDSDPFGKALLSAGIPAETIKAWSVDPRVKLPDGEGMSSIFDALEDTDVNECLEKLAAIQAEAKS